MDRIVSGEVGGSLETIEAYNRLLKAGITRKIVKPAIMNKPYNATG